MELEQAVADLAQTVFGRYYGKYRGLVRDNADPKKLGRLKLQIPSVLGTVVSGWAFPCLPYGGDMNQGFLFIPEVDAGVWVEFEEGDLEFPIWVGTFWSEPTPLKSEVPKANDPDGSEQSSVQNPPTRKIIKTKKGHTIQFEDADGEDRIIITDGETENRIVFTRSGITITNKNNSITMTDTGIIVEDTNSNKMTQDANGTIIEDLYGNKITMDSKSGGQGVGISVNGDKKVCLEGLVNWLMSHTHLGNMGAPCPLNPADMGQLISALSIGDGNILSMKVKAG